MRTINTSGGPKQYDPRPGHTLNTSRLTEEDLTYVDEPAEIVSVVAGGNWCAVIAGEDVPLPLWVLLDDGTAYGAAIGEDGLLDPLDSVEKRPGFNGYTQANNDKKER